ncbi:hypothetical protein N7474_004210 [Penicillium riverlandense]|uniref:uncharacterized protein n=1 Tax=Penicillium riverlandense TaxID=1903569 RepID=UPI002548616D|nr:uncharacterized protein N7474_004210 [Penicillium riverlandense]KAJ5818619.1 hypothetical protein N7474_004210 [Penicillium riverlandense]
MTDAGDRDNRESESVLVTMPGVTVVTPAGFVTVTVPGDTTTPGGRPGSVMVTNPVVMVVKLPDEPASGKAPDEAWVKVPGEAWLILELVWLLMDRDP